jgi:hypothetical protein
MALEPDYARSRAGLCASCVHSTVVTSSRGSVFFMCQLSRTDPDFPRYPALPVLGCRGYVSDSGSGVGDPSSRSH